MERALHNGPADRRPALCILLAEHEYVNRNLETLKSPAKANGLGDRVVDGRFDDQEVPLPKNALSLPVGESAQGPLELGPNEATMATDLDAGQNAAPGVILDGRCLHLQDRCDLMRRQQLVEYRASSRGLRRHLVRQRQLRRRDPQI